jgi:hypothetical protein
MEELTAVVLNARHSAIIAPEATVSVPFGWTGIVGRMLSRLEELPSATRAFLVVTAIEVDVDGLLHVDMVAKPELMANGSICDIEDIIRDARNHAAWSCVNDTREAWIVRPPRGGTRPLCPTCQQRYHIPQVIPC